MGNTFTVPLDTEIDIEAALAPDEDEQRPDEPSLPLGEWMAKNLFGAGRGPLSVVSNTILTLIATLVALFAYRGILNFIFSEERSWDAVRVNLRLLFTFAYPDENYTRVWIVVAIAMVLAGLSLGLARKGRGISMKKLATWMLTTGALIALGIVLREPSVLKDGEGAPLLDVDNQVIRQSFGDAMADRLPWWIAAVILLGAGLALWLGLGDLRRRTTFVPTIPLALAAFGVLVSTLWWFNWGSYTFADGESTITPGIRVVDSTRNPWTLMWLVLVAAFLLGRVLLRSGRAGTFRGIINGLWLLSPFVTFFAILRGPVLDWAHVRSTDLPIALAFIFIGGLVLWALTRPSIGETGRIIAAALVVFALYNWITAFLGGYHFMDGILGIFKDEGARESFAGMLQSARLSFLFLGLAALLAPNFIGEAKQRLKLIYGWVGFMAIFHILVTLINTPSSIDTPSEGFAGAFTISIYVAIFTMIASFPLGVLLALARTSKLPLFRIMSTAYIESFRGVPLITMLFFFTVFVNLFLPEGMELSSLAAVTVAFTLFSAAYLAENVRGGLQSVRQGQYEASDALGLTTVQRTMFITLPQGLRVSIPPLVGQVIGTFKETSLLAIVGVFDFLRVARDVIPAQPQFLGVKQEGLLFVSALYFVVAYSMSKYSQRLEKQLGVGER